MPARLALKHVFFNTAFKVAVACKWESVIQKLDFNMDMMSKFGGPAAYYFLVTGQVVGAG